MWENTQVIYEYKDTHGPTDGQPDNIKITCENESLKNDYEKKI